MAATVSLSIYFYLLIFSSLSASEAALFFHPFFFLAYQKFNFGVVGEHCSHFIREETES